MTLHCVQYNTSYFTYYYRNVYYKLQSSNYMKMDY